MVYNIQKHYWSVITRNKCLIFYILFIMILGLSGCGSRTPEKSIEEIILDRSNSDMEIIIEYLESGDKENLDEVMNLFAYINDEKALRNYVMYAKNNFDFYETDYLFAEQEYKEAYMLYLGTVFDEVVKI